MANYNRESKVANDALRDNSYPHIKKLANEEDVYSLSGLTDLYD